MGANGGRNIVKLFIESIHTYVKRKRIHRKQKRSDFLTKFDRKMYEEALRQEGREEIEEEIRLMQEKNAILVLQIEEKKRQIYELAQQIEEKKRQINEQTRMLAEEEK